MSTHIKHPRKLRPALLDALYARPLQLRNKLLQDPLAQHKAGVYTLHCRPSRLHPTSVRPAGIRPRLHLLFLHYARCIDAQPPFHLLDRLVDRLGREVDGALADQVRREDSGVLALSRFGRVKGREEAQGGVEIDTVRV